MQQLVVALPEQINTANAGLLREQLLMHIECAVAVLIADMSATISCDHAGADALAGVYQQAVGKGTELRLVISTQAVRRVIAISGLDRLVVVFPTLGAAQMGRPPAEVLRLPSRAARTRSAGLAVLPDSPRPVSWFPVNRPAAALECGHSTQQAAQRTRFAGTLTQITSSMFRAGLILQTATGLPAPALAHAVEQALHLLDSTISQARTTAFALAHPGPGDPAGTGQHAVVLLPGMPAGAAARRAAGEDATLLARRLTHEARQTRAQSAQHRAQSNEARTRSRNARAHAMQLAELIAATRHRVAATFSQTAVGDP